MHNYETIVPDSKGKFSPMRVSCCVKQIRKAQPFGLALAYLVFGLLWIYGTDSLVEGISQDSGLRETVSLYKGILFVVVTAILFYKVLSSRLRALQQSISSHYEYVIKNANDIFFLAEADEPRRIVEANDRALLAYGYSRDALIGMPISVLRPPEFREQVALDMENYFERHAGRLYETFHQRKDGSRFPVEINGRIVVIDGQRFSQAVIRDISERKLHESMLAISRQRLLTLIDSLPDPAWMKDHEGRYLVVNEPYAKFVDAKTADMIGKTSEVFFAPEAAASFQANEQKVIDTCTASVVEYSFFTVDGMRCYETVVVPIQGQNSAESGTVGIARDITERKTAEEERRRHAEEMVAFMANIPEPAVRFDESLHCIFLNPAAQQLAIELGFEMMNKPIEESGMSSANARLLHDAVESAFATRKKAEIELVERVGDRLLVIKVHLVYQFNNLTMRGTILCFGHDISEARQREVERHQHEHQINDMLVQTIHAMALTVEKRDPYTAGHQDRTARLAVAIGLELGLPEHQIQGIRLGGMIHDIGKIYVPSEILNRPGRLTEPEMALIRTHPEVGYDIVKGVEFIWPVKEVVLQHHERFDGTGYPHGLKGNDIAIEARIVAVADVIEAISSHRPYRPALGVEQGLEEIRSGSGTRYDPVVAAACLALFAENRFHFPSK